MKGSNPVLSGYKRIKTRGSTYKMKSSDKIMQNDSSEMSPSEMVERRSTKKLNQGTRK